MKQALAIRHHEFGKPLEVLTAEQVDLPEVGEGQVLLRMLASVINPSDFGMIGGSYGRLPDIPAIAGREGVGEVVEVGSGVENVKVGDRVRMSEGCWCECKVADAAGLWIIPDGVPLDMAAMAFVNPPTAWRLLRDADLRPGQWVIQNAANSAVGLFVIQMAKSLGIKTINIVRRPELVDELKAMGADIVLLDTDEYPKQLKELTGGGEIKLALNSIGGESAIRLVKALSNGGTHITFGAMAFEKVRFPTRFFIFNDITLKGFWMDKWFRDNTKERAEIMYGRIWKMMKDEVITAPVAGRYALKDFKQAIEHVQQARCGKILFTNDV
jgi:NADPH:quinone reductase-like Zn-dependent oxidoreductase